jgi:diadenosine tetraphosphate (Ap4A) HIT family hydrolase
MNETARKFGYPDSVIHEFDHWLVQLRPAQVTLGSLVLVCKDDAASFGAISAAASTELQTATNAIETALATLFANDKINYLMLMMVDPDVHFHVLPRYATARDFGGASWEDAAWPGPPDITSALAFSDEQKRELLGTLRGSFTR